MDVFAVASKSSQSSLPLDLKRNLDPQNLPLGDLRERENPRKPQFNETQADDPFGIVIVAVIGIAFLRKQILSAGRLVCCVSCEQIVSGVSSMPVST